MSKPIEWMGRSRDDLSEFPVDVKRIIGFGLYQAQNGERHVDAKPLGQHIEIVVDFRGNTYRAVYTVKLGARVYVLHCFQKKSTKGIATPKRHLDLIEQRYKEAAKHNECLKKEQKRHKEG